MSSKQSKEITMKEAGGRRETREGDSLIKEKVAISTFLNFNAKSGRIRTYISCLSRTGEFAGLGFIQDRLSWCSYLGVRYELGRIEVECDRRRSRACE